LRTPVLIVVCGLSFAGKTTLATAIARRCAYEQVDVDDTKVRLFGVTFEENSLDQEAWNRIYEETDREIQAHLAEHKSVVDASRNFKRRERDRARALAHRSGARVIVVYVDTPERVARQRMLANRCRPTRVDWGDASFEQVVLAMQPPAHDEDPVIFHYEDNIETWITEHSVWLAPRD
jgi:predicted kinase